MQPFRQESIAAGTDCAVLRVFQITGLTRAFALHPSVLDAIAADQHWQAAITGEGHGTEEWCREHGLL